MSGNNVTVNPSLMRSPEYYSPVWLLIGILFLLLFVGVIVFIFYLTRKKPVKKISTLKPEPVRIPDLSEVRRKYLALVDEIEKKYSSKAYSAIIAHQELSLTVRLFYAEAGGFHAEVLTLRDLKKSKNTKLATLIEQYYPEEFSCLEHGQIMNSIAGARTIINDDEVIQKMRKVVQ